MTSMRKPVLDLTESGLVSCSVFQLEAKSVSLHEQDHSVPNVGVKVPVSGKIVKGQTKLSVRKFEKFDLDFFDFISFCVCSILFFVSMKGRLFPAPMGNLNLDPHFSVKMMSDLLIRRLDLPRFS